MLFKREKKPWYMKSAIAKHFASETSLAKCKKLGDDENSNQFLDLKSRIRPLGTRVIILNLYYYARIIPATFVSIVLFYVCFHFLSPPADPFFITSLGLFFVVMSSTVLASCLGDLIKGRLADAEVDVDSMFLEVDAYTQAMHGFKNAKDLPY